MDNKNNIVKEPFGTFDLSKAKPNPYVKKVPKGKKIKTTLEIEDTILNYFNKKAKENSMTIDQMVNNYLSRALV